MRIPEKRLCDLCRLELTGPHVRMAYPLDDADRALIQAHIPAPPPTLLHLMFMTASPDSWSFEFCRGCAEGFMPMLADLKTQAIKGWLEERARRAETPIGESD